jgi:hypothetical protein
MMIVEYVKDSENTIVMLETDIGSQTQNKSTKELDHSFQGSTEFKILLTPGFCFSGVISASVLLLLPLSKYY